jgi:hypothetical protein
MADNAFEFYKLMVEEVREARRARRELSNMFLTLNTGGVGALGFLAQGNGQHIHPALPVLLTVALVLTSVIWATSNHYYTLLLAAKYKGIYALEAELGRHPIEQEWVQLQGKRGALKWFSLERMMPALFMVGYALFLAIHAGVDFGALYERARELVTGLLAQARGD